MKVLVTGSTGFVGSHLCEKLTELGHDVYSLARNPKKFEEFQVKGKMIIGSLSPNKENEWINDLPSDLDAIIHTAGIVHSFDWSEFYSINTKATEKLINDLKVKFPTDFNFIFISSLAASGPATSAEKVKEHHEPRPVSHYGKSKRDAEVSINQMAPTKWNKVIIRPPMVIGPRDPAVLEIFKMVKNGAILVAGLNGMDKRYSFICVHDLVDVIIRGMESTNKSNDSEVYFATHPQTVTFREIVNGIKKSSGKKWVFNFTLPMFLITALAHLLNLVRKVFPHSIPLTPDKINEIEPDAWVCCHEKSCEKLNFDYKWDLEKTISITLEDYRQRNWL
ncbi:MAG: NAD-dependent epimerase/dehydratase family protein [Bacteriovoracaceae bacterium]|nr:NAD-dependent epimerase/dehydratase family protein [Bacteriovoracaceae bacterium]